MRVAALTGCTLAAVTGVAAAAGVAVGAGVAGAAGVAAGASPSRPDSGIRGTVLYGPTCPVQRPGHACVRPYRAWITIRREPAETVATRVRSAANGRFSARLAAGRYLVQPRNGKPFPRAASQTVTVRSHRFSTVTIRFDSGIR